MNLGALLGSLAGGGGNAATAAAPASDALAAAAEETTAATGVEGEPEAAASTRKATKSDAALGDVFATLLATVVGAPLPDVAIAADGAAPTTQASAEPGSGEPVSETPDSWTAASPMPARALARGADVAEATTTPAPLLAPSSEGLARSASLGSPSIVKTGASVAAPLLENATPTAVPGEASSLKTELHSVAPALENSPPSPTDSDVATEHGFTRVPEGESAPGSKAVPEPVTEPVEVTNDSSADFTGEERATTDERAPKEREPRFETNAKAHASSPSPASAAPSLGESSPLALPSPVDGESHRLTPWSAAPAVRPQAPSASLAPTNSPAPLVEIREPLTWSPEIRLELAAKSREYLDRGITEIRLTLDPPSLGKLRIRMEIGEGRVSAHLVASSPHAAALLDRDRGELVRAFEAQGIDDVSVHIGTERDARGRGAKDEFEEAASPRVPRLEEEELEASYPPPARTRRARIDLVV